jgi:O-antigen/teichoic acid export membrane protein
LSASHTIVLPPEQVECSRQEKFRLHLSDIGRQSSISLAGTVFTLLLGYGFKVYLARELGPRLLGWNALGMGVYGMCKLLGEAGLPAAALRFAGVYGSLAKRASFTVFFWRALFGTMTGTALLCAAVVLARNWIANRLFHDPGLTPYLPLYAVLIPIGAASSFLTQTLCGFKMIARSTTISKFISFPLMIVFTIVALVLGLSLWGYVVAQIAGECFILILAGWSLCRAAPLRVQWYELRGAALPPEVRWYALAMMGMGVLGFVAGQADRLILGYYLSAKQVGIYAVAASAGGLCAIFLQALNSIFAPTIAMLHEQAEHALLLRLYQTLTKWILAVTLPIILTFLFFSRSIMGLFGPDFQAGWPVLVIITLGQIVNCGTGSVGYLLLMCGNQNRRVRVMLIMAVTMGAANLALIPVCGVAGAAAVSAAGTILSNITYLVMVRRTLRLFPYERSYWKLVAPAMAATAALWFVREHLALKWASISAVGFGFTVASVVFFGAFLCSGLTEDDRLIVNMAKRRLQAIV